MENAAEAGVADDIRFCRADSAKLCLSGQLTDMNKSGDKDREGGIIITNPPYGERIGDKESIDRLYAGFRTFLKKKSHMVHVCHNARQGCRGTDL